MNSVTWRRVTVAGNVSSASHREYYRRFIAGLKDEADAYAGRVDTPSGEPQILDYGEEPWLGKLLLFNGYETSVPNGRDVLPVFFSLLYRE